MYDFELVDSLTKKLGKIKKKNTKTYGIIQAKIIEIISSQDVNHYKNLRKPLQHLKRVHINASFVLVFSVNESKKLITFVDFDHHDNIYRV